MRAWSLEYLERKIPADWPIWDLQKRLMWLSGGMHYDGALVERQRICAQEVWCECLRGDLKYMKYADAVEINAVLASAPGWSKARQSMRFSVYGVQKGYARAPFTPVTLGCNIQNESYNRL